MLHQDLTPTQKLEILIRARYPVIWIVTSEEVRVERAIHELHAGSPWLSPRPLSCTAAQRIS